MSTTVAQVLTRARRYLGTKVTDPRYSETALLDEYNSAIGQLYDDCAMMNEDVLATPATLIADTSDGTRFVFADQASPITDVVRLIEVRERDAQGATLDELVQRDLTEMPHRTYALTGAGATLVLQLPQGHTPGTLFVRYIPIPPIASDTSTLMPSWIPDRFADVPALMVAVQAFPFGGEERVPGEIGGMMDDRLSRLWENWGSRSGTLKRRKARGEGQAPYLFT